MSIIYKSKVESEYNKLYWSDMVGELSFNTTERMSQGSSASERQARKEHALCGVLNAVLAIVSI